MKHKWRKMAKASREEGARHFCERRNKRKKPINQRMKVFLAMLKKMCIFAAIFVGTRVPLFIAYDRQIQDFRPSKGCA